MKKHAHTTTRTGLSMRWVPVTSGDGRVRLEMRWSTPQVVVRRSA
jgi:hypothetical protein